MYISELDDYIEPVYNKLKSLERKFELSCIGLKDQEKLLKIYKDLKQIKYDLEKLKKYELTWEDLKKYNITANNLKKSIQVSTSKEANYRTSIKDFIALAEVPIEQHSKNGKQSINEFYSIINYFNDNYLNLFTQKILISSVKTSSIREIIYLQYQEILRLFKNYINYIDLGTDHYAKTKQNNMKQSINQKEYQNLLQKLLIFTTSIKNYIYNIQNDSSFTEEDFNQNISGVSPDSRIYGLTLKVALEECLTFTQEFEEYLHIAEKDIIDIINISENKKEL